MTETARDDSIAEIITEFSQVFAFVRMRWARYAEDTHPDLRGIGLMMLQVIMRKGPITATEIATMLALDKAVVSRQLSSLRAIGFIESTPSEEDRRVTLITASSRARKTIAELQKRSAEDYRVRFNGWDDTDLASLQWLLHRFNAAAEEETARQ